MKDRFDDLIDDGAAIDAEERARLRRVHDLLLQVEAPPEVGPALRQPPPQEAPVRLLPRRRRAPLALVAAAIALAVFGGGYLVGERSATPAVVRTIVMEGTAGASGATAAIELLEEDDAGNWPMRVRLRGLEPSEDREDFYELWLTREGELAESCGRFTVHEGVTEVTLSVPYRLRGFDGWVVTRSGSDEPLLTT
ncbi:MAG TPA: anti-sigma factor [Gaiellaceae bacterium]|nr:anti-sigma factor [Gaiellaceae bacterium]